MLQKISRITGRLSAGMNRTKNIPASRGKIPAGWRSNPGTAIGLFLCLMLLAVPTAALSTVAHGTVNGEMYVASTANWDSRSSTNTFTVPNGTVVFARYYVGVWTAGGPGPSSAIATTFNGHAFATNPSYYISGMGVTWIPYDVTDYVTAGGVNTATVNTASWGDGRQYGSTLVVVVKNETMPETEYWVAEGLDWLNYQEPVDRSITTMDGTVNLSKVQTASLYSVHLTGYNYEDLNGYTLPTASEYVGGGYFDAIRWDNVQDLLVPDSQVVNVGRGKDTYCSPVMHALSIQRKTYDLVPVSLNPNVVIAGTNNTLSATIENWGGTDSPAFNAVLLVNGAVVDTQAVGGLSAWGSTGVDFHWTPDGTSDTYSVSVVADYGNAVNETDETNNNFTILAGISSVPAPVAAFTADVVSGIEPFKVIFTDQSGNSPISWAWDFNNDGTVDSTVQNPTYTYVSPGVYTVSLAVSNAGGSNSLVKTGYITVWTATPPVAGFTATPTTGDAPLTVQFSDTSVNATSWAWDFNNDGTVDSTVQNPSYTYPSSGIYSVKLTVGNVAGSADKIKTDCITVFAVVPVAGFDAVPRSGTAPLTVWFTDQSTNEPTSWEWDFDNDGTIDSTEQNPSYTYLAAGTYTVKLVATNPRGSGNRVRTGYVIVTSTAAPVASFSADPASGTAPLTVQFTDESSSTVISERIANGGFESGNSGWTTHSTGYMEDGSVGIVSYSPHSGKKVAVFSMSGGGSEIASGASLSLSQDVDLTGTRSLEFWYLLGDECSGGDFGAKMYIGDDLVWQGGITGWEEVTVDTSSYSGVHTISFALTANSLGGPGGMWMHLDDISMTGTGGTMSWAWDFDNDGTMDSTEQNPVYTYATPGTYPVKLTVTNAVGSDDETLTITISESPIAVPEFPTVAFPVMVISAIAFLVMMCRKE